MKRKLTKEEVQAAFERADCMRKEPGSIVVEIRGGVLQEVYLIGPDGLPESGADHFLIDWDNSEAGDEDADVYRYLFEEEP